MTNVSTRTTDGVDDLSTVELVERLQGQVTTLIRTEIGNALAEVKTKGTRLRIGIGLSGAGLLLLLYGLAVLMAAAILGLATAVAPWLAALIVAAVVVAVGAALAGVGAARAKRAVPPLPQQTAESIRDDLAAIKEGPREHR